LKEPFDPLSAQEYDARQNVTAGRMEDPSTGSAAKASPQARKPRRASVIANLREDEALALVARKLAECVGDRDGMTAMRAVFEDFDVGTPQSLDFVCRHHRIQ
jgi:hypothetical protein